MPFNSAGAFNPTDIGNAERLLHREGAVIRYVQRWGHFVIYDGSRWQRDETASVERMAKKSIRALVADANDCGDPDLRSKMLVHAMRSEQDARIRAMVARLVAEPGVSVTPKQFDAHPWLLNVANGVLDLERGVLRPHEASLYLTKKSEVLYDPNAECPTWERFLLEVFAGNIELVLYVQRAVGYSLTGFTVEQCLHILYGLGSNGKSVLLVVLLHLFGEYGANANFATFLDGRKDGPRNDLARLAGARFVRASEIGEGRRFNEALIKELTGSEPVTARFLYAEDFEYQPAFHLWLAANHKPVVRGVDPAIWRRLRLIPFEVTFEGDRRDRDLTRKLMAELPGILRWAVEGCRDWQNTGLQPPGVVAGATADYRRESDTIGGFLEECCETGQGLEVRSAELYAAYRQWTRDNGEFELSQTAFGRRLEERGLGVRKAGVKHRQGLRLLTIVNPKPQEVQSWHSPD